MRGILSLQSEVVYGHVGNSVARFALQRLGFEVWSVPTVLYSNHPGHGDFGGDTVSAKKMTALVEALDRQSHLAQCDAVLTGYARTADQITIMADVIDRVKTQSSQAVISCDPVLGDVHTGVYVPLDVADSLPKGLVPRSDILMPNLFELETLSEETVTDAASAVAAARSIERPLTVCTSIPHEDKLATIAVTPDEAWMVLSDWIDSAPHGVGDLTSALFLGHRLCRLDAAKALQKSVSSVFALVKASAQAGSNELLLIDHQDLLIDAPDLPCTPVTI